MSEAAGALAVVAAAPPVAVTCGVAGWTPRAVAPPVFLTVATTAKVWPRLRPRGTCSEIASAARSCTVVEAWGERVRSDAPSLPSVPATDAESCNTPAADPDSTQVQVKVADAPPAMSVAEGPLSTVKPAPPPATAESDADTERARAAPPLVTVTATVKFCPRLTAAGATGSAAESAAGASTVIVPGADCAERAAPELASEAVAVAAKERVPGAVPLSTKFQVTLRLAPPASVVGAALSAVVASAPPEVVVLLSARATDAAGA